MMAITACVLLTACKGRNDRTSGRPAPNAQLAIQLERQGMTPYVCCWAGIVKDGYVMEERDVQRLVVYLRVKGDSAVEVRVGSKNEQWVLNNRSGDREISMSDKDVMGGLRMTAHMAEDGTHVDSLVLRTNYMGASMEMHFTPAGK